MKGKRYIISWILTGLGFFAACRKPEKPWKLPEGAAGRLIEAHTGPEYDTVAFISLESGMVHKRIRTAWDLLLKPAGAEYEIWLNAAMYAFAAEVDEATWHSLSAPDRSLPWRCDLADTAALPLLRFGEQRFFILDRDRADVFYRSIAQRYRKVKVHWEGQNIQILSVSLTGGDTARWQFPAGGTYYLSMERSGDSVSIAPPWRPDLVLTRYVHPFYDQPEEFRWYPVLGALLGEEVEAAVVRTAEIPYEEMDFSKVSGLIFTRRRDVMGYDWKRYDFGTGTYTMDFSRYFVLRTGLTTYYKLRFIDFYDGQGRKGSVKIEYEPM